MSTGVRNVGAMEGNPQKSTNVTKSLGANGDLSITLEGIVYHFGVNELKVMEDRLAAAAVAADSRLRIEESNNRGGGAART